jgi:hypothetical protein
MALTHDTNQRAHTNLLWNKLSWTAVVTSSAVHRTARALSRLAFCVRACVQISVMCATTPRNCARSASVRNAARRGASSSVFFASQIRSRAAQRAFRREAAKRGLAPAAPVTRRPCASRPSGAGAALGSTVRRRAGGPRHTRTACREESRGRSRSVRELSLPRALVCPARRLHPRLHLPPSGSARGCARAHATRHAGIRARPTRRSRGAALTSATDLSLDA